MPTTGRVQITCVVSTTRFDEDDEARCLAGKAVFAPLSVSELGGQARVFGGRVAKIQSLLVGRHG